MTPSDTGALLKAIGMGVFVEYYYLFKNPSLSVFEIVDRLPNEYTLNSRRTRASKARRIFRDGLEIDALRMIVDSERADPAAVRLASEIRREEYSRRA
jgi:hypothetical protein